MMIWDFLLSIVLQILTFNVALLRSNLESIDDGPTMHTCFHNITWPQSEMDVPQKRSRKLAKPKFTSPKRRTDGYESRVADVLSRNPDHRAIDRLYLGRAGEFFVASHLLRRGLNSAPLPVDTGVDLLAYREMQALVLLGQAAHELYQFQVKTTSTSEYRASLPVRKIHDLWHKAINLVIVFWNAPNSPTAIVFPPRLIRMLTSGGFQDPKSPLQTAGDEVSLRIITDHDRYFIRNKDNEITAMTNRFDRIEPSDVDTTSLPPYASWSDGKGLIDFERDYA